MGSSYMWGDVSIISGSGGGVSANSVNPENTSTLTRQVGGDHYKKQGATMQPWAIIDAWGLDFYAGNVLKYILRHQYKDGVEDLKKARHYLDRMIEKAEDQTVFDALKKRNAGKYDENPS